MSDMPTLRVVLREPTGRARPVWVYGGAWIDGYDERGLRSRYAYTAAVPTSHGVSVLVADRLYGPEVDEACGRDDDA